MRITKALLVAALIALATPAFADQANLDRAVKDALKTFRAGGEPALQQKVEICETGVDWTGAVDSPQKQVEYCAALEFAGLAIIRHDGKQDLAEYFKAADVWVRVNYIASRARVIELPEQVAPYWTPRIKYVNKRVEELI
ncbi:hypothetical protein [Burkholderia ubonensis]|uniref:Uncharacterized protein n=1 Tax=Burkholderia ubonensis TaxID=101571 RepID=A0ABD4DZH0_9BURK|nr:hypothetical protein [Burkholderia ubonensis]KVN83501.1 hypothetical protein WJ68_16450 [Burkholderia ubonensis]